MQIFQIGVEAAQQVKVCVAIAENWMHGNETSTLGEAEILGMKAEVFRGNLPPANQVDRTP